ncbi:hypothetical protein J6590_026979 [Homalodisca vitripennis]|nr:hypothetical protein J6590_026979 [Homalodisca vitripennis]
MSSIVLPPYVRRDNKRTRVYNVVTEGIKRSDGSQGVEQGCALRRTRMRSSPCCPFTPLPPPPLVTIAVLTCAVKSRSVSAIDKLYWHIRYTTMVVEIPFGIARPRPVNYSSVQYRPPVSTPLPSILMQLPPISAISAALVFPSTGHCHRSCYCS